MVRRRHDINKSLAVGGSGDLCVLRNPIENVRATTKLADPIQQPGDEVIADGIQQLSNFLMAAVAQNEMISQCRNLLASREQNC